MNIPELERITFFPGQRLHAEDLTDVQTVDRELRWLHNRSLHTWGIGLGFGVTGEAGASAVAIVLYIGERSEVLLPKEHGARERAKVWVFAALNSIEPPIQHLTALDLFHTNEAWAKEARPTAEASVKRRCVSLRVISLLNEHFMASAVTHCPITWPKSFPSLSGSCPMCGATVMAISRLSSCL